jgi:phosphate starvation-inducible PhoH-like protein
MRKKKAKVEQETTGVPLTKHTGLVARTDEQQMYIDSIKHNDITICIGPAGSGKTFLCTGVAVQMLRAGLIDKIIVTRPMIGAEEDPGALPGGVEQKIGPYLMPIYEELKHFATKAEIVGWKKQKIIDVVPLAFIRGRNFHRSFIILDESQNCTWGQLKALTTRIGKDSKVVINGDITQTDLKISLRGGLQNFITALFQVDGIGIITMTKQSIVRHRRLAKILERLEEYEDRQRQSKISTGNTE